MNRVLLLSENISIENHFYENLQRLNYEVFSSASLLEVVKKKTSLANFLNIFQIIIVSETISKADAKVIIENLEDFSGVILRKTDEVPLDKKEQEWQAEGFTGWVLNSYSLEALREKMAKYKELGKQQEDLQPQRNLSLELLEMKLTPSERTILSTLMTYEAEIVPREILCEALWGEKANASRLSQLSFRIGKIKEKIANDLGVVNPIVTVWKKGYRLQGDFYQELDQNAIKFN